jgi:hypothetical protein
MASILRKGYTAHRKSKTIRVKGTSKHKSYVRRQKSGSYRVKASKIKDRGLPGKGPKLWSVKKGGLGNYGYSTKDGQTTRRAALKRGIQKEGPNVIQKRLVAIANYNKRTSPKTHSILRSDIDWLHKHFFSKL